MLMFEGILPSYPVVYTDTHCLKMVFIVFIKLHPGLVSHINFPQPVRVVEEKAIKTRKGEQDNLEERDIVCLHYFIANVIFTYLHGADGFFFLSFAII